MTKTERYFAMFVSLAIGFIFGVFAAVWRLT